MDLADGGGGAAAAAQDEVIIVDEFTGRTMPGRRWGDGLHQAVEAKEGITIQDETITLASISYQARLHRRVHSAASLRRPPSEPPASDAVDVPASSQAAACCRRQSLR